VEEGCAELSHTEQTATIEAQRDELETDPYVSHLTRTTLALARGDHELCLDQIDAAREQGEYETMMIEYLYYLAPVHSHRRCRRHLELIGIPGSVVAHGVD